MDQCYFKIRDHIGLDPQGNPEPGVAVGLAVAIPTMIDGEIVSVDQRVAVPPLEAGSRIFASDDPIVVEALRQVPTLEQIDAPTKADISKSQKETQASRDAAGTHVTPEEAAAADAAAAAVTASSEEA